MTNLSFDLQVWPWPSAYLNKCFKNHATPQENNCAKLFWNPCINVEVMAQTSSIYDHFIIWPAAYLNKCCNGTASQEGQLCWIILKSMRKCRSSGLDKLNLWPFYHLTFNLPEQMFQMTLLLVKNYGKLFWNPCIHVGVMAQTSSIYVTFKSSVTFTFNLPEKMFQTAILLLKENNCAKLFWNPCMNIEVMAWTNPNGRSVKRKAPTYTEQKM